MPTDPLVRVLLVVWTAAGAWGCVMFARGFRRNWRRRARLRDLPRVHPGRFVLAGSRLRRDAVYFGISVVALLIALGSVAGPPGLVGPGIGIALTAIMAAIIVEGHLSQLDDRRVERWNAPRDGGRRPADPPSHARRPRG